MADDNTTSARARMIQGFRNSSGRHGDWMARRNALLQRQAAQANPGQGQGPAATQGGPAANPGPEAFMGQARDMIAKGNVPPMVQGPGGPQFAPNVDRDKLQETIQQSAHMAPEGARQDIPPRTQGGDADRMAAVPVAGTLADRARGIQAALGNGPAAMAPFAARPAMPTLPVQAAPQAQQQFVAQPVAPPAAPQAVLPVQAAPQAQAAVQTQPAAAVAATALPQQAAPQAQVAVQAPQAQAQAAQAQQAAAGQANAQVNQSAQLAAAVQAAQKPAAPPQAAQPAAPAQPAQPQAQQAAVPAAPAAPAAPVAQPVPAAPAAPGAPAAQRLTAGVPAKDEMTNNQTSKNQLAMAGKAITR